MFERIFVLYDFSPTSRQALEWAVRLGARSGSRLKILHVTFPLKDPQSQSELVSKIREDIDDEVGVLAKKIEGDLKGWDIEVVPGDAAAQALKAIRQDDPDLIVLGTHGRNGLTRVLMGSVAEKIVRYSPFPVLVARKAETAWPPRRILVPVDWDESVEETLLMANELQRAFSAHVDLIHVLTPPAPAVYASDIPIALPYFDEEAAKKEIDKKLKDLAAQHPKMSMIGHVAVGHPATEICGKAREIHADIILVPTHGRKGFSRFFMGSVAEQVVRYAPCHVLSFCPAKGLAVRQRFLEEF